MSLKSCHSFAARPSRLAEQKYSVGEILFFIAAVLVFIVVENFLNALFPIMSSAIAVFLGVLICIPIMIVIGLIFLIIWSYFTKK